MLTSFITHADGFHSGSLVGYLVDLLIVVSVVVVGVGRLVRLLISFLTHADGFHSGSLVAYLIDRCARRRCRRCRRCCRCRCRCRCHCRCRCRRQSTRHIALIISYTHRWLPQRLTSRIPCPQTCSSVSSLASVSALSSE